MLNMTFKHCQYRGARAAQQDAFAETLQADESFTCHGGKLIVLADGHGIKGGEAAKRAVQEILENYHKKRPEDPVYSTLEKSIYEANRVIFELYGHDGVGFATVLAIVLLRDQLYWVSCGNSRLYIYREGHLTRLTQDHVYAIDLYDQAVNGQLALDDVEKHPQRLRLTSYLGMENLMKMEKNYSSFLMKAGDKLLLCTDGVYDSLTKKEILNFMKKSANPARTLIGKVKEKNIPDQGNATALCLAFELNDWAFRFGPFGLNEKLLYAGVASLLLLLGTGLVIW